VGRMGLGASVVPELREILLSTSEGAFYGPDGRLTEVREVPFLAERQLSRLGFDPDLGRSRLVCVLTGAGKTVTATIDAGDFPDLRDNTSKSCIGSRVRALYTTPVCVRPGGTLLSMLMRYRYRSAVHGNMRDLFQGSPRRRLRRS
jgi:hypothetical protein